MEMLCELYDPFHADYIKSVLESEGIKVFLIKPDLGGTRPSLSFVSPVRVMVDKDSLGLARDILDEIESE